MSKTVSRRGFFRQFASTPQQTMSQKKTAVVRNDMLTPLQQASRFLGQATLGANRALIRYVKSIGYEAWLDEQFALPQSEVLAYFYEHLFDAAHIGPDHDNPPKNLFRYALTQAFFQGEDLLRQKVAIALGEIIVVSNEKSELRDKANGMSSWYDMLLKNAFGNFRDLLFDVTLHPMMGNFLSHGGNRKRDPVLNTYPDENYAREIMQLFTIGLFWLNEDGTLKLDTEGNPIPTYDNDNITEFARVFTGLQYDFEQDPNIKVKRFENGRITDYSAERPMKMWEAYHDRGKKRLLNGKILPSGQPGIKDIHGALNNLFYHPNVGAFIGKQLIQRLVKSNPSPAYVARVTAVFNNNGAGKRGDMKAVIKAILLDDEARHPRHINASNSGKLREPFLRFTHLLRAFNFSNPQQKYWDRGWAVESLLRQYLFSAPSVFNFFLPSYSPAGPLGDAGLVAPEFQLHDTFTAVSTINFFYDRIDGPYTLNLPRREEQVKGERHDIDQPKPDLSYEVSLLGNVGELIDHLDLLLTHGTLSTPMRNIIRSAVAAYKQEEPDKEKVVQFAIHLFMISPEYAIQV